MPSCAVEQISLQGVSRHLLALAEFPRVHPRYEKRGRRPFSPWCDIHADTVLVDHLPSQPARHREQSDRDDG